MVFSLSASRLQIFAPYMFLEKCCASSILLAIHEDAAARFSLNYENGFNLNWFLRSTKGGKFMKLLRISLQSFFQLTLFIYFFGFLILSTSLWTSRIIVVREPVKFSRWHHFYDFSENSRHQILWPVHICSIAKLFIRILPHSVEFGVEVVVTFLPIWHIHDESPSTI